MLSFSGFLASMLIPILSKHLELRNYFIKKYLVKYTLHLFVENQTSDMLEPIQIVSKIGLRSLICGPVALLLNPSMAA